jgi:hypothetical protein
MRKAAPLISLGVLLLASSAFGQIRWTNDLEKGLREARDRDAPILAFFWDYN